ncbi:hypothetical protein JOQ06_018329 [Pogonophryne albipinna]|uniref:Uncharacterized protein n=1 Tax=Pogonophryne albipinna TaxID=1090488 RepID=A0AAD6F9K2_9TELE|nr:hypothetical protein JOQ06_018329 [Pogonophryne albipinna]
MQTSGPQPAHYRGLQSHFIPQKTHGESQFTRLGHLPLKIGFVLQLIPGAVPPKVPASKCASPSARQYSPSLTSDYPPRAPAERQKTPITPAGSVVGMSPAWGHRVAAARGLLSPLLEKCHARQISQGGSGETAPLRAQEDQSLRNTLLQDIAYTAYFRIRASSCQRCPQREKGEGGTVVRGPARKPSCERRGRSSSTAPRTATKWPRTDPDYRRRGSSVDPKCRELIEQQGVRAESKHVSHRREIKKKAEAELAALEELRLSRAMAFVSISPTVGGCMSLEEEMMQAKRKHKPMMKQLMEQTTVLKS